MPRYSYRVFWSDEDEGFIGESPEFPTLSAFGETPEEAVAELGIVLDEAVQLYQAEGWPVPVPRVAHEYSGQLRLRLPKSLHRELAMAATEESVSLNQLLVTFASRGLGQQESAAQMARAYQSLAAELLDLVTEGLSAFVRPHKLVSDSTFSIEPEPPTRPLLCSGTTSSVSIERSRLQLA